MDSYAVDWLRKSGFDPAGDLVDPRLPARAREQPNDMEDYRSTALFEASLVGELEVVKWLFEHGAASTLRTPDSQGKTPLFGACSGGHLDVAKWLHDKGASGDISVVNKYQQTPMIMAAQEGHLHIIKWLFSVGATQDVRTKNHLGQSPMLVACSWGHLHVCKWLFDAGASQDVFTKSNMCWTPMHVACLQGQIEVLKWLLGPAGASQEVHARTKRGTTTLLLATKHLKVMQLLLAHGVVDEIRLPDRSGSTPLQNVLNEEVVCVESLTLLVLNGAACGEDGHVNGSILGNFLRRRRDPTIQALRHSLSVLLEEHSIFVNPVLAGIRGKDRDPSISRQACEPDGPRLPKRKRQLVPRSLLEWLQGHDQSLVPLIADFAGIIRGRKLRNAKEMLDWFTQDDTTELELSSEQGLSGNSVQSEDSLEFSDEDSP